MKIEIVFDTGSEIYCLPISDKSEIKAFVKRVVANSKNSPSVKLNPRKLQKIRILDREPGYQHKWELWGKASEEHNRYRCSVCEIMGREIGKCKGISVYERYKKNGYPKCKI